MNILLIHQYAGNKGDRAVLFAMCSMIKSVDNSINISVSTSSPELWTGYGYYKEQQIEFIKILLRLDGIGIALIE